MAYDSGLDKFRSELNSARGRDPGLDRFRSPEPAAEPAEPAAPAPNPDQNESAMGDFGTAFGIGVRELPGTLAGVADIVNPLTRVDPRFSAVRAAAQLGEATGFQPGKWAEEAADNYSPQHQQYRKELGETKGFLSTLGVHARNPLQSAVQLTESLPAMLLPGGVVRGAAAKFGLGATGRMVGAGVGEGAMMGGAQTAQLIDEGVDPSLAANVGLATGVAGGAMGVGGGALARKMGLNDIDTLLAGGGRAVREGAQAAPQTWKQGMSALVGRVIGGGVTEGGFEELPQSVMEQMLRNYATGRPILEGAEEAGATGFALGALAGGGMNVPGARRQVDMTQGAPTEGGGGVDAQSALQGAMRRQTIDSPVTQPATSKARSKYEAQLAEAFDEPSGFRVVDENGIERELSNYEYYYREATGELPPMEADAAPAAEPAQAEKTPFDNAVDAAIASNPAYETYAKSKNRMAKLREEIENAQSIEELQELANSRKSAPRSAIIEAYVSQLQQGAAPAAADTTQFTNPQGEANGLETQPVRSEGQSPVAENADDAQGQNAADAAQGQDAARERQGAAAAIQEVAQVSIQDAEKTALPAVQQAVFDHMLAAARDGNMDDVIDGAGVIQYAKIAKAMGKARGSIKVAVDGAMRNIAKAQGMTVEEFKSALKTRSAAVRTTETAASESLGLQPAAQATEVDAADVFGAEGNAPSMEIVASPGQTNANANSDAMDAGNEEGTEWLKQVGALQGRNALTTQTEAEDPEFVRKREAEARANAAKPAVEEFNFTSDVDHRGQPIQAVDVADAAAEYDEDLLEGDLPFAQLPMFLQRQWVKVWIANQDGAVSAQQLMRTYTEIADESSRATKESRRVGGDQVQIPSASAERAAAAIPEVTEAEPAEESEEGLTADEMVQQWDAAAQASGYVSFAELSESQRDFILGSATWAEFNEAAQEVAAELQAKFSEGSDTAGSDAATLEAKLKAFFLSPMRFNALVTVVQSQSELPEEARGAASSAKGKVQGFVMNRRVYMIADNIAPGTETAVMLHEIGVHLGMKGLIGSENLAKLSAQVRAWTKRTGTMESRLATKAMLRAVRSSSQSDEEVVAYFVEEAVNAGINPTAVSQGSAGFRAWFRTLWAAAKSALRKVGLGRFDQLKAQNLVDLAYGAAQLELHGTWHGTAADFRRFDHSYMNSGEGAQAFGWGTYLAQRYGIAKGYFEADTRRKEADGTTVLWNGMNLRDADQHVRDTLKPGSKERDAALTALSELSVSSQWAFDSKKVVEDAVQQLRYGPAPHYDAADWLEVNAGNVTIEGGQPDGSLMRVVPQVEDDELLDWEKPLSEQSDKVQKAVADDDLLLFLGGDENTTFNWTGQRFYHALTRNQGSGKAASEYLDSIGIKGVKYFDARSRTVRNRNTPASFPEFDEMTRVLAENDFLGFESRGEVLDAVLQDGMAEMRRNFDLPPDLDGLLTAFEKWMKSTPEAATRNLVIFNDRNMLRVATRVGGNAERVKFSEAASVTTAALDNAPEEIRTQLKKFGITVKEAFRTTSELLMFTEDLVRRAKTELTSAAKWYEELSKREQTRMEHKARVDDIAVKFDQLERNQFTRTWKLIHDMTSQQAWAYTPSWKPDVTVDVALKGQYDALSTSEQALVDEVLKHGNDTVRRIKGILNDVVQGERETALARARTEQERKKIERDFNDHAKLFHTTISELEGPYAPMRRVGSHVVVAKSQAYLDAEKNAPKSVYAMRRNPAHYRVEFYDSLAQAKVREDKLKSSYAFTDAAVKEVVSTSEGLPFEAFDKIRKMIAAEGGDGAREAGTTVKKMSSLLTELYLTSLAETSARKSELHRDNVAGVDVDAVGPDAMYRAFLSKGTADAHYIGTLQNGRAVSEAFAKMRREADEQGGDRHSRRRLFNELSIRYDNSLKFDAAPLVNKLMNFGSVWMLLTKPAYFFYNATQPLMLTQPALAQKHGYAESGKAMLKAYKQVVGLKSFTSLAPVDLRTLPLDVRAAVLELRNRGRIDITITQDLGERIHGATTTVGRGWQKAERVMKGMAQKVEMTNRVVSAMAAFRLAKAKGLSDEAAIDYASDIIYDTHGDYSNLNAPRLMNQTQAQRLIFQFRKFQFIQIGQLVRMWKEAAKGQSLEEKWALSKAFRYTLAHHAVLAGAMGLPAASVIAMMLSAGADDDEPFDPEFEAYKAIGNPTLAALLLHGVPAALFNVNMSRNIGMGQTFSILPFADVSFGEKGGYEKLVTAALGPVIGGLGSQMWDAVGALKNGDVYKGMEAMLPSGLRSAAKSFRESLDGVENRAGDTLVRPDEIDAWQTAVKVAGFKTESDAVRQMLRGAQYEYEKQFSERTTVLKKQYRDAYRDNDAEAMKEARANWLEMQAARRMMGFKPRPMSELLRSPREQRKRERNTAGGVQFNSSNRRFVQMLGE